MKRLFYLIHLILIAFRSLMIAIYNGQTTQFTKLIKQGIDINFERKETHLTAIQVAIRKENEIVIINNV